MTGPFGPRPGESFLAYTDRLIAECRAKIAAERARGTAERQAIKAERLASIRRMMETGRVYRPSVPSATSETDQPGLEAPLYWWNRDDL